MNTALNINDINLLQAQNEGLKKQNKELQAENIKLVKKFVNLKTILNNYADKFDNILEYIDELEVRSEDENGYMYGEERALWGDGLDELDNLITEFIDFVIGVE